MIVHPQADEEGSIHKCLCSWTCFFSAEYTEFGDNFSHVPIQERPRKTLSVSYAELLTDARFSTVVGTTLS